MFAEIVGRVKRIGSTQLKLIVACAVLVAWMITYREDRILTLWSIAALLDAIPGLMAFLLLFTPKARTVAGSLLKGIAVALLIVAPLFSVVFIWITIASPLFFALGVIVLSLIERSQNKREAVSGETGEVQEKISSAQWTLVALIVAFTIGSVLYSLLMHHGLGHSAAMFLGIPAVLAILLALTPKAKTVTGGILKGITLALLVIAPLLGEGYLCILVASPLFYFVGIIIGIVVDKTRRDRSVTLSCVALVLLPLSLEGVIPTLSFNRSQTVEVSRVVAASADTVEHQLALSPEITTRLPRALCIGFPRPLKATGEGLEIGALRTIHFAGAEGDPPGDLTMRVAASRQGYVRFETVSDTSKLTQWIAWTSSEVHWKQIDGAHSLVTWRVHFERQLDPAWYFAPLERAAVHEAARYLIEANAKPQTNAPPARSN